MKQSNQIPQHPIIDFHAHAFPEKIAEAATQQLASHYKINVGRSGTISDLVSSARSAGITGVCLHAAATNAQQVEINNNWIAKQCSEFINGFGSIHVDYENCISELDRMEALGLTGIKLHPEFQGFALDDPRMWPVYEAIDNRFLVMFHVGDKHSDLSNPIRLRRVLDSFPRLKAVAAHLGGWSKWAEAREHILGQNVYLDTSSTTWVLSPEIIADLIRSHDIDKVLFGTDYPVVSHSAELEAFLKIPLSTTDQEKILWKNAKGLLKKFKHRNSKPY